jgi:tetratricopeptide (TPR) repeat protein/mono/diheme cytochrome c family protein
MRRFAGGVAVCLAACGTDPPQTSAVAIPDTISWAEHVAPIVRQRCAACHRPGGVAPISLLTLDEVRAQGPAIRAAVESGRMPPWLPEPGPYAFAGERRLTPREIATIRRWVELGMPPGDTTALAPPPAAPSGWPLGEPDLVLEMPEPYRVPAGGHDHFRNFVVPVPLTTPRWIRTVDLQPGEGRVVHHAVIEVDRTDASRRLDAADPDPGFDGMFTRGDAQPPGGFFLGWTPGMVPYAGTPGLAWRLDPASDLVLQLHLQPAGESREVRAKVGLYFADGPPTRHAYWITLGSRSIDVPAGRRGYEVRDEYVLPVGVEVLTVYPHAHYLGKEIEATAELPNGEERRLLRIADWDFNQQDAYRYVEPVSLPPGTKLEMRIFYDNTAANPRNPHAPPRRVRYGPESSDEMGNVFVQVIVSDSSALAALHDDFARKYQRDLMAGLEFLIRADPSDAASHNDLGQMLYAAGRLDEAVRHFREALEAKPDFLRARFNLGTALEAQDKLDEAIDVYVRVLQADSSHTGARYNLASILHARGEMADAIDQYRKTLAIDPAHAGAHNNLGNALVETSRPDQALGHFVRAIELDPDHAEAHNNLANLLRSTGQLDAAVPHYRAAVQADPIQPLFRFNLGRALVERGELAAGVTEVRESVRLDGSWPVSLSFLAWTLATEPEARSAMPNEAVRLAERAAQLTDYSHPGVLDALAAAYAAAGQFGRAVSTAQRAVEVASSAGDERFAERIRGHLAYYERGEPFRSPARR